MGVSITRLLHLFIWVQTWYSHALPQRSQFCPNSLEVRTILRVFGPALNQTVTDEVETVLQQLQLRPKRRR